MNAQQALECLDHLDANELFDFSDGDVSGSGSDVSYDGDLADDSGTTRTVLETERAQTSRMATVMTAMTR